MKPFSVVVCSVFLLAACGQKGPLYLPDNAPPPKPYSECDAADAPCRQPAGRSPTVAAPTLAAPAPAAPAASPTESSTLPGASSTESTPP